MGPGDLSALRGFFAKNERRLPEVVAAMYNRLFAAVPDAMAIQRQPPRAASALHAYVAIDRQTYASRHLWPIGAFTGTASLPILDKLGCIHADVGITRAHFDLMKSVLSQCCREVDPAAFTPPVEKALGFIFDVVANSLTKSSDIHEEELARKNKLPLRGDELPVEDFNRFFGGEALVTELLQAQTLH